QLEGLSYYQVLQVDPRASAGQVRSAYHQLSRQYHPDRYFHLPECSFKAHIYRISKRITEAYVVLREPGSRAQYDQQLAASKGAKLRYTEESAKAQKKAKEEVTGKTEKGRKSFQQGQAEVKKGNFPAAERAFKMALVFEPDNELFEKALADAQSKIKVDYTVK
ncbi:MAG TPA: DnaJ domain-containing protein, partial [Myxococcota bacterium]|nr:DnaJ domain-containing protein [Myxococcota bacterium]